MNLVYLHSYLAERFPVINMVMFAILFFTVSMCSAFFSGIEFSFGYLEFTGALASISFFFRLRVFDEIKDFDIDSRLHPHRVLQTGKISLTDLKILASILLLVEICWSWFMGLKTFYLFGLLVGYSLLMRYEFFVSDFLKKRLALYAISHMLIMPLIVLWIWSAYQPVFEWTSPLIVFMILSILGGFSFELARKIHAPDSEVDGQDSYSKSLGLKQGIATVSVILLSGVVAQYKLLELISASYWSYGAIGALFMIALGFYIKAWYNPEQKLFRKAERLVSLFMLFSYVTIVLEIIVK